MNKNINAVLLSSDRFTAVASKHMTAHHAEQPDQMVITWDYQGPR